MVIYIYIYRYIYIDIAYLTTNGQFYLFDSFMVLNSGDVLWLR